MTLLGIVCLLTAAPLVAQDKPDFSGRWVLVSGASAGDDVARALVVRQSVARTNLRGEPMRPFFKDILIEREFASAMRSETLPIGVVGGFVSGIAKGSTPTGPRAHHVVKWDGSALVFEHGTYTGDTRQTGKWSERREVWSLEPDGRLRVAITSRSSADVSETTHTLTYQPAAPVQKPTVAPFFVTDPGAQGPSFFVECINTTSDAISSGSDVWPLSKTAIRLDGTQLIDEGGRIGPGLTTDVPPGGKWSGILQLRQSATGSSPAVAFGALVRAEMIVPLSAGEHTIAVRCGDTWSDPVRFFFETHGTPNAAYQSAAIDSNGRLVITTADRRTIHVLKEGEQSSFGDPKVSPDRTAVGVQALFPNLLHLV